MAKYSPSRFYVASADKSGEENVFSPTGMISSIRILSIMGAQRLRHKTSLTYLCIKRLPKQGCGAGAVLLARSQSRRHGKVGPRSGLRFLTKDYKPNVFNVLKLS